MQRSTIPGRSAYTLQRLARLVRSYATLVLLVAVGVGFLTGGKSFPLQITALVVMIAAVVALVLFWVPLRIVANLREVAEVNAGYTTMPRAHQEVEERDPLMRRLVRVAGEPFISEQVRSSRLSATYEPSQVLVGDVTAGSKPGWRPPRVSLIIIVLGVLVLVATLLMRLFG